MIEYILYKNDQPIIYYPVIRESLDIILGFKYRYFIIPEGVIVKKKLTKSIVSEMIYQYYLGTTSMSPILIMNVVDFNSDREFLHKTLGWNYYSVIYSYIISDGSYLSLLELGLKAI